MKESDSTDKDAQKKVSHISVVSRAISGLDEESKLSGPNRQLTLSKFANSDQGSQPQVASYVSSANREPAAAARKTTGSLKSVPAGSPDQSPTEIQDQVDALCPAVRKMGYTSNAKNLMGEGAFSKVYRARSNRIPDRDIAVKIVRLDDPNIPQAWKEYSMKRELKILKRVRHPNVITIYDVIKTRTRIYVFMDLAAASVSGHLEATEEPASEQTARNWFGGISNAISYLHRIDIAHRDLKNENILIDSNGQAKLTDFGFACFTYDRKSRRDVLSNTSCGTRAYVAPEVFNPPYNAKISDVWSLGVCLYECTTLSQPFRDDLPIQTLLRKQMDDGLVIPKRFRTKLSSLLQDLLHKMIEPDIRRRIHSEAILVHPWMRQTVRK